MGKGASLGKEAALAASGRAGEVDAWVGRVRRATFSASCQASQPVHRLHESIDRLFHDLALIDSHDGPLPHRSVNHSEKARPLL